MIQHIYLVRHGQTQFNAEMRIQGQGAHSPLTEKGQKQAELLGERLQKSHFQCDYIFSSPLERALNTAKITAGFLNQEIILEDLLMEISCGEFEGKLFSELDKEFLDKIANNLGEKYPGGESSLDVRERGIQFLEKIKELGGETAIIFSHGNFIRNFAGIATGLPAEMFTRVIKDNSGISYLSRKNGFFRIITWNDTSHLNLLPPRRFQ